MKLSRAGFAKKMTSWVLAVVLAASFNGPLLAYAAGGQAQEGQQVSASQQLTLGQDGLSEHEQASDGQDVQPAVPSTQSGTQTPAVPSVRAATISASKVKNYFNGMVGKTGYAGWCLKLVDEGYAKLGFSSTRYASALKMMQAMRSQGRLNTSKSNIPVGAYVFYGTTGNGHVGVWVGDGLVNAHGTKSNDKKVGKDSINLTGYGAYQGWAFPAGLTVVQDTAPTLSLSGVSDFSSTHWHLQGNTHPAYGTITSNVNITSATAAVYNSKNQMVTGATKKPNATSVSIVKTFDSSLQFSKLSPGVYNYVIKATAGSLTKELWSQPFAVLSKGRTIADGMYNIKTSANQAFAISIENDNVNNGANAHVWQYKDTNVSEKWNIKYVDNGYYTITNVRTGKMLNVAGNSASASTNVQQWEASSTNTGNRWQILPDAKGGYRLVPECAKNMALDYVNGEAKNKTNVQIWNIHTGDAERWYLTSTDNKVTKVALDVHSREVWPSDTSTLKATVTPVNATNGKITWSSSNTNVATVDQNGTVKTKAVGTAVITASAGGKSDSCTYKVVPVPEGPKSSIEEWTIEAPGDQIYTGKALTPKPKVNTYIDMTGLGFGVISQERTEGKDYTLSYSNNVNVGTATITVTGIGSYTGTRSVTFKIKEAPKAAATWTRLGGTGALDTMQQIVQAGWGGNAGGTVVVATRSGHYDALSASGVAGLEGAPVLLTDKDALNWQTVVELQRIRPSKVIIAGGPAAVSEGVARQIRAAANVEPVRLYGANACRTAEALNQAYKSRWATGTAILATKRSYHDALSAAPVAYARHMPVFLTSGTNSIDDATIAAMKACGVSRVVIMGGTAAVGTGVESRLRSSGLQIQDRLGGDDARATSKLVAEWGISQGMGANRMGVATAGGYYDALTGAALCGRNNAVLVLADDAGRAQGVAFAKANKAKISQGYVFGGELAVGKATFNAFVAATK